ncbi:MAG: excalibur calcium-binding domain-containing protein [Actinomycetota bacterium]|nr:excalibur calcium-binding domain-containing protein [Actinomycetota bacterium]
MTDYSRAQFGQAWADTDRNGCDQRNDILRRDLAGLTIRANTHGCTVLTGVLQDPYTGGTISFTRGYVTSSAVQIDHVIALGNAWVTGAARWSPTTREQFANDPLELLAVAGTANQQKGDGDTATWLPANKSYRCQYVARQIAVKSNYHLAVTTAELAAMRRVLATCPLQALPTSAFIPLDIEDVATAIQRPAATRRSPQRLGPAEPTTTTTTATPATSEVYYQNCSTVRAAGKAPLSAGQPGYRTALDRDRDGIACEKT